MWSSSLQKWLEHGFRWSHCVAMVTRRSINQLSAVLWKVQGKTFAWMTFIFNRFLFSWLNDISCSQKGMGFYFLKCNVTSTYLLFFVRWSKWLTALFLVHLYLAQPRVLRSIKDFRSLTTSGVISQSSRCQVCEGFNNKLLSVAKFLVGWLWIG